MGPSSKSGHADVLVGLQYGDEGKAKVVDLIAEEYGVIARFNGGANAGHTIVTARGPLALKQVPSGVFYPDKLLYVGSGCVVGLEKLVDELAAIEKLGLDVRGRLFFSDRASMIQPHHVAMDKALFGVIGTTKNGIGAAYADKALRMKGARVLNFRLGELVADPKGVIAQVRENYVATLAELGQKGDVNVDAEIDRLRAALEVVRPYVQKDPLFLPRLVKGGKSVLFEGAQSVALDVTLGNVPFVTSSSTIAAAAYPGGDLPPIYHRKVIGVTKALMSRVGAGPFVPEYGGERSEEYCAKENADGSPTHTAQTEKSLDVATALASEDGLEVGRALRVLSGEYGTGTKRPRRIGALDLFQLAYAVESNAVTELYINKCDLLVHYARTREKTIPLVVGYSIDGQRIDHMPLSNGELRRARPIFERMPSFEKDVTGATKKSELPKELVSVLEVVEKRAGCKIRGIGTGPEREGYVEWGG
jgi:adenylosuccinate synthase